MDFNNREIKPQPAAPNVSHASSSSKSKSDKGKLTRVIQIGILAIVVILLVGVITFVTASNNKTEDSYVDSTKLQAVFLNTGQVYFGSIKSLNNRYFVLSNIYYLQTASNGSTTSTTSSNSNVTLVKLGCELHEPYDQMVINSDQVTFWENLSPEGQVAKAVATFKQQNPQGQKCADQSSSSNNNSSNSVQSAGTNNSSTTPTTPAAKP